jgi:ubiquinone/menaquinone biosynthesis C-methylase UbiE
MRAEYLVHLALYGAADIHPGGERATDALMEALRLEPGSCVLEVGCGTGNSMARLLVRPGVIAAGLDYTPEMLQMTRRRLQWAGFADRTMLVRGKAQRLPFADASFDRAYAESVLGFQDTDDIRNSLQEIFRVLRPGGRFAAIDAIWNDKLDESALADINAGCLADFGLRQSSEDAWRKSDWLREFQACGFRVENAELCANLQQSVSHRASVPLAASLAVLPHKISCYFSPSHARMRRRYRKMIEKHLPEGELTDAVMFVLRKPEF